MIGKKQNIYKKEPEGSEKYTGSGQEGTKWNQKKKKKGS